MNLEKCLMTTRAALIFALPFGALTSAATLSAQSAEPPLPYVYETDYYGLKPDLTLSGFTDPIAASYTASQSMTELERLYNEEGRYGIVSGSLDASISGNVVTGYWYEDGKNAGLSIYCAVARNGTFSYGRYTFTFNADRTAFTGLRSGCDEDPVASGYAWDGQLARREPISAP
jgi:hypothetical protein